MSKYATLGQSCQVNGNELISNAKFLPLNDPVYNLIFTKMETYPYPVPACDGSKEKVEQVSEKQVKVKQGCC